MPIHILFVGLGSGSQEGNFRAVSMLFLEAQKWRAVWIKLSERRRIWGKVHPYRKLTWPLKSTIDDSALEGHALCSEERWERTFDIHVGVFAKEQINEIVTFLQARGDHQGRPSRAILDLI
ncbi:MAG: hypothetical protein Q9210_001286 [Variospora velana]